MRPFCLASLLSGLPLTPNQCVDAHYRRVADFQRLCFSLSSDIPALKLPALAAVSAIDAPAELRGLLDKQELLTLLQMATHLNLVDPQTLPGAPRPEVAPSSTFAAFYARLPPHSRRTKKWIREFLTETLCHHLERRPDQIQQLNALSLYPSEEEMWNEAILPADQYTGDTALALPKLNLQFLTIHDYLLRNFNLFRLESIYEIREDVQDAIFRMKPRRKEAPSAVTGGSARMALELQRFSVVAVEKPKVGETVPAEVRAELSLDLAGLKPQVAREWDALRQFDVLFLVAIVAPKEAYTGRLQELEQVHQFPEKFGVVVLRGCEVVEVLDEDGKVISEFNPLEPRMPMGTARTLRVLLDPNQYSRDVLRMEEEGFEDFYSCFNLVIRRHPKHNTFKAVLSTIRSLMNHPEDVVIPAWLHDLFLGFGDPGSAQFFRLPSRLRRLDFRDTFLDLAHLREALAEAELETEGNVASPPFVLDVRDAEPAEKGDPTGWPALKVRASTYTLPAVGPYPDCVRHTNKIRFTPQQVRCLLSGLQPGLTMVVGPPGSGKTDTAAHLAYLLYHNFPSEKVLLVSHSNAALNDLFRKIKNLDVDETHLLRLGRGEQDLYAESRERAVGKIGDLDDEVEDFSFSKQGRVNMVLERRKQLLEKVEKLGRSLEEQDAPGLSVGDVGFSCETALQFYRYHVLFRMERFRKLVRRMKLLEEKHRRVHADEEEEEVNEEEENAFWSRVSQVFSDLEQERGTPLVVKVEKARQVQGEDAHETNGDEQEQDENACISVDPVVSWATREREKKEKHLEKVGKTCFPTGIQWYARRRLRSMVKRRSSIERPDF
ncbi:putative aquarius [Toxoplasma gondii p89]|uniref:Putative aquarius n=1 Tax=Toxoplasma gondii p89 TaxID=943119 RepID=A0A086KZN3_TOXGO|nr:putative aquarius [Toxoplasma gondii p89]